MGSLRKQANKRKINIGHHWAININTNKYKTLYNILKTLETLNSKKLIPLSWHHGWRRFQPFSAPHMSLELMARNLFRWSVCVWSSCALCVYWGMHINEPGSTDQTEKRLRALRDSFLARILRKQSAALACHWRSNSHLTFYKSNQQSLFMLDAIGTLANSMWLLHDGCWLWTWPADIRDTLQ